MMRITNLTYNQARECMGCAVREEKQISTYILSFQIADQMLRRHQGEWKITGNEIILHLQDIKNPLTIDVNTGIITYGTISTRFINRYSPENGVNGLVRDLCSDLAVPEGEANHQAGFLLSVFVKLVEIFHARCDLRITPGKAEGEWEIKLGQDGLHGWIGEDGIAENRFGEKVDILQWENLRPEKAATYIFGFNRFCSNFQCPMK